MRAQRATVAQHAQVIFKLNSKIYAKVMDNTYARNYWYQIKIQHEYFAVRVYKRFLGFLNLTCTCTNVQTWIKCFVLCEISNFQLNYILRFYRQCLRYHALSEWWHVQRVCGRHFSMCLRTWLQRKHLSRLVMRVLLPV